MMCDMCGSPSDGVATCARGHAHVSCFSCLEFYTKISLKKSQSHSKNARQSKQLEAAGRATELNKRLQLVPCMTKKCNASLQWMDDSTLAADASPAAEATAKASVCDATADPTDYTDPQQDASCATAGVQSKKSNKNKPKNKKKVVLRAQAAPRESSNGRCLYIDESTPALFVRGLATQTAKADVEKAFPWAEVVSVWQRYGYKGPAYATVAFSSKQLADEALKRVRAAGGVKVGHQSVLASCVLHFKHAKKKKGNKQGNNQNNKQETCDEKQEDTKEDTKEDTQEKRDERQENTQEKHEEAATCSDIAASCFPLLGLLRLWGVPNFKKVARELEEQEVTADVLHALTVADILEVCGGDHCDAVDLQKLFQSAPPAFQGWCPFCRQWPSLCEAYKQALVDWNAVASGL